MSASSSIQTTSPLQTPTTWGPQTDLDRIAYRSNMTDDQKIGELAKEFEAMLFKQVLKGMKQTFGGSSMFPSEGPHSIYGDMMIDNLAQSISHAGQIGFAKTFADQMTNKSSAEQIESNAGSTSTNEVKEDK